MTEPSVTTLGSPQNDDDLAVAFLFGAPCPVDMALSRCAVGELEALEMIARLVETRVLQPVPRASIAPATMRLVAVRQVRLHRWYRAPLTNRSARPFGTRNAERATPPIRQASSPSRRAAEDEEQPMQRVERRGHPAESLSRGGLGAKGG
jgi:hypothetical protein